MAPASGDQYTIRIGGDASGPVVAGRGNRVDVRQTPPGTPSGAPSGAEPESTPGDESQAPGPVQTNTANDHGSVFTVMNGEMHIHHGEGSEE
ncbi:hypothetical protein [Streptomyces sp. XD-27]|uniref:hypothetical protein n=1 Tax=Streptomyces sp. XD-27 TaxID=3062779 RepID=UPI0026F45A91|nr:hypothetical protein [Streptomyces sp. XD-27]WKX73164.1 hypothetical protein Q3Y56_27645 [Streptomyces sp. XD-27]